MRPNVANLRYFMASGGALRHLTVPHVVRNYPEPHFSTLLASRDLVIKKDKLAGKRRLSSDLAFNHPSAPSAPCIHVLEPVLAVPENERKDEKSRESEIAPASAAQLRNILLYFTLRSGQPRRADKSYQKYNIANSEILSYTSGALVVVAALCTLLPAGLRKREKKTKLRRNIQKSPKFFDKVRILYF